MVTPQLIQHLTARSFAKRALPLFLRKINSPILVRLCPVRYQLELCRPSLGSHRHTPVLGTTQWTLHLNDKQTRILHLTDKQTEQQPPLALRIWLMMDSFDKTPKRRAVKAQGGAGSKQMSTKKATYKALLSKLTITRAAR